MGKSKTAMSRKSSLMRSVRWNTPSKLSRVRERGESHRRHPVTGTEAMDCVSISWSTR